MKAACVKGGTPLFSTGRMKFKVSIAGIEKELEVTRQGDRLRIVHDGAATEVRVVYTEGAHFVLEYDQDNGGPRAAAPPARRRASAG
jgi:hypothetical protein